MDIIVEMMRTTHNHHILRDSLRLLTAAVRVSPVSFAIYIQSIVYVIFYYVSVHCLDAILSFTPLVKIFAILFYGLI